MVMVRSHSGPKVVQSAPALRFMSFGATALGVVELLGGFFYLGPDVKSFGKCAESAAAQTCPDPVPAPLAHPSRAVARRECAQPELSVLARRPAAGSMANMAAPSSRPPVTFMAAAVASAFGWPLTSNNLALAAACPSDMFFRICLFTLIL